MAEELKDLEPLLSVGCPAVFHSDRYSKEAPRYSTLIRGWRKPSYLLLDRPKIANRYAAVRENQLCVLRFVHGGKACAFDSMVLDWDNRQYNAYCRVEWPKTVQVVSFRKHERVRFQLPCKVHMADADKPARIQDLSTGGCRLFLDDPGREGETPIEPGATLEISFKLPDGCAIDRLQCAVRNAQTVGETTSLGCQFMEGQIAAESSIAFFIATTLDRTGAPQKDAERILIIDENAANSYQQPESADIVKLHDIFRERGYEVIVATEMLDGFARLRMLPPIAVLINYAQSDLNGLLAARLIKMTRGFEDLPIFLHNGADAAIEEQAVQIGATGCFNAGANPVQIVNAVLARVINGRPEMISDLHACIQRNPSSAAKA